MKYHTVTHIHAYLSNNFDKLSRQPDVTSHIILLARKNVYVCELQRPKK